jgi:cyclophilin family peptidyl-prolyl cis-trans isomerase
MSLWSDFAGSYGRLQDLRDWAGEMYPAPPPMTVVPASVYRAVLSTSQGPMVFRLLPAEAPVAVNSFVFLARQRFYDGLWFHRIIEGFLVQGGDPTATGSGGTGYTFPDEPVTRDYVRGTLAMANARPGGNSSQFFIVHQDARLTKRYTIFGTLQEGFDALDRLAATPVTEGPTGEVSRPAEPALIERIEIIEERA